MGNRKINIESKRSKSDSVEVEETIVMNGRKIHFALTLCMLLTFILAGCGSSDRPYEEQGFHMGTIITEQVYGSNATKAGEEAMKRIAEIEDKMTINAPGSEIDKLNEAAGESEVSLSRESVSLLDTAKEYSRLSDGAFDVSIGPLVKTWGVFTKNPKVPGKDEIDSLRRLVDYRDISIDSGRLTAKLARKDQMVDLGGIAKGYAGDEALRIYKKYGIKSAYINLGGNVVVLGSKPDGTPWKVGVQNPRAANGRYIGILEITGKSVVSSGDYERFFEKDGVRYHHILDPKTGYPADSGLIGTTIVADSSTDADALSTATFVLGLDRGMQLVESLKGVDAVFVTKDKKVYVTSGLRDKFKFDDESKEYQYVEKR